jgi:hypothetical protein
MRIFDIALEFRINLARRRYLRWPTHANKQHFIALVRSRSPQQVARMRGQINEGTTPCYRVLLLQDSSSPFEQ